LRYTLVPDFVLDTHGATSGVSVTIEDGRVVEVGSVTDGERLHGKALSPGFVNDHSHAFQRGLRGKVERLNPELPHDDFWTWRQQMYSLAEDLDPDSVRHISERCFREMLAAGYTGVTEFHYVHHRPDGSPYEDPNALAKAIAEAAESAGIRLLLLPVAYGRGGVPRFRDPSPDDFLRRVEALLGWAEGRPLVEVGAAAHSVRAVSRGWLEELGRYARAHRMPLHVHADEQPREVSECEKEHGVRPVELLAETGFLDPATTIVHATHANERELDLLAEYGSGVCVCPTTEGNLGDGFLPAEGVLERGIQLSVGSDQHVRLDPLEELRELETNARRLSGRRNVLISPKEDSPTPYLLRTGWQRESIDSGALADLVEVDLNHPQLADVDPEYLPSALVFGAGSVVVSGVWVAGSRVYPEEET
jgi:formimidoylglutamate deiminase